MREDPPGFDPQYARTADLFGAEPDAWLLRHAHRIPPGERALDVGAGQGRHALHLARAGIPVDALDPSAVGLAQLTAAAAESSLPVRTFSGAWEDWEAPEPREPYGAVLLFGLVPLVRRHHLSRLVARTWDWLRPGGLAFVTAHTTADAGFGRRARGEGGWVRAEDGSFRDAQGAVRTYLEPGELARRFGAFEALAVEEAWGPWHRHGDGAPERHAMAAGLFRRPIALG